MIQDELMRVGLDGAAGAILVDAAPATLIEKAVRRREGVLSAKGCLMVETGAYTGRSPKDRFIVDTQDVHDDICWGEVNKPFKEEDYARIKAAVIRHLSCTDLYIMHTLAGADAKYTKKFLIVCERASQALFVRQLLVRPTKDQLEHFGEQDWTVLAAPDLKLDPALHHTHSEACVLINFSAQEILVVGTQYSGEIKKSIFSVMNYIMPKEAGVLPMHSSANMDPITGESAVFFGLSGTGKTTLSADPARMLIGDDEHGWADDAIFNFEGGCYAKAIRISLQTEPEIFKAIRFGAMAENVIVDPISREPDYFDATLTENTRVAYPIDYIDNAQILGVGRSPNVVIFLTCDSFGVLPPIAKLTPEAAMYHFLSGFTSKVAGTERGIKEPKPTFSTLFGEPFMPLSPLVYATMFGEKLRRHKTRVYLINTGWTGGPYGVGSRIQLTYTRHMVSSALSGAIENANFVHDDIFNVDIPDRIDGVDEKLLMPKLTWSDGEAYDAQARKLAQMFIDNAREKYPDMPETTRLAGPHL